MSNPVVQPDDTRQIGPLLLARGLRDFGDGFVAVLLPAHLLSLGLSPLQIGVLSSVALLGAALITLLMGVAGAKHDRRQLLLVAACLMAATGLAFSATETFAVLLLVAFVGTINPSGGSVSVFVPLEHAVLAAAARPSARTALFARYSLIGALAGAFGALAAGSPDLLARAGIDQATAIRGMFVLYALLGVAAFLIYRRVPRRPSPAARQTPMGLGPSRKIVIRLALLFSLDFFAGGFMVQSLLALWLFERFDMSIASAGLFFSGQGCSAHFRFRWRRGCPAGSGLSTRWSGRTSRQACA